MPTKHLWSDPEIEELNNPHLLDDVWSYCGSTLKKPQDEVWVLLHVHATSYSVNLLAGCKANIQLLPDSCKLNVPLSHYSTIFKCIDQITDKL